MPCSGPVATGKHVGGIPAWQGRHLGDGERVTGGGDFGGVGGVEEEYRKSGGVDRKMEVGSIEDIEG